jgi:hypothetical protein
LQQFKQQWQAMISGVMQSWKTPVVEADVDWIDLQKNNRDMEYSSWMEYLIKLACAIYSIDPTEIGWDISRSNGNSGLFEASQAERLQNSKDKPYCHPDCGKNKRRYQNKLSAKNSI